MGYGGGTDGADNNIDVKNAPEKAAFNTYNVADVNTDADASITTGMRDAGGIGGTDNNTDSKNGYAKAGFGTYNVAGVNADADADADNTSNTSEKGCNNTNNTGEI